MRRSREVPFLKSIAYLNSDPSVAKVLVLAPRFPTFYLLKNYQKPVGRWGEESMPNARDTQVLLQNVSSFGITHGNLDRRNQRISSRYPSPTSQTCARTVHPRSFPHHSKAANRFQSSVFGLNLVGYER